MNDTVAVESSMVPTIDPRVSVGLEVAHSVFDDLFAADLSGGSDAELLASYLELERLSCRLAAAEHAFIAEVEARSIPFRHAKATTGGFLRGLLRLHPAEAKARVAAAAAAGPRRAITGEALSPIYVKVAAAQAAGVISPRHAAVVVRAVETLAADIRAEHDTRVEADLVDLAAEFDPHQLVKLAHHMHACLDPDGQLQDANYRERLRDLTLRARPDGSSTVAGELTAECTERLLSVFDALGAPKPEVDGQQDPRSAGQRRHDALLDALAALPTSGALPTSAGVATTIIVTMDEETFRARQGLAETSHGALVPAEVALRWGDGDRRMFAAALSKTREILAYSTEARLFCESQRLAIATRDRGCTFPGCTTPAAWTQVHHIDPWAKSRRTSVDNGALLCGFHHRHFELWKWRCVMIDGRPAWIPPPDVDSSQTPRRNRLHEMPLRR